VCGGGREEAHAGVLAGAVEEVVDVGEKVREVGFCGCGGFIG
jgi:hypothetical protein